MPIPPDPLTRHAQVGLATLGSAPFRASLAAWKASRSFLPTQSQTAMAQTAAHEREVAALHRAGMVTKHMNSPFGRELEQLVGTGKNQQESAPRNAAWEEERELLRTKWKRVSSIDPEYKETLSRIVNHSPSGALHVKQLSSLTRQQSGPPKPPAPRRMPIDAAKESATEGARHAMAHPIEPGERLSTAGPLGLGMGVASPPVKDQLSSAAPVSMPQPQIQAGAAALPLSDRSPVTGEEIDRLVAVERRVKLMDASLVEHLARFAAQLEEAKMAPALQQQTQLQLQGGLNPGSCLLLVGDGAAIAAVTAAATGAVVVVAAAAFAAAWMRVR